MTLHQLQRYIFMISYIGVLLDRWHFAEMVNSPHFMESEV